MYHCFSEEGIQDIVARVQELYQQEHKQSASDVEPIKSELKELEQSIDNWIEALGRGTQGLEDRIVAAEERQEVLRTTLQQVEMIND